MMTPRCQRDLARTLSMTTGGNEGSRGQRQHFGEIWECAVALGTGRAMVQGQRQGLTCSGEGHGLCRELRSNIWAGRPGAGGGDVNRLEPAVRNLKVDPSARLGTFACLEAGK